LIQIDERKKTTTTSETKMDENTLNDEMEKVNSIPLVVLANDKALQAPVTKETCIGELKTLLRSECGAPEHCMRLYYDGAELGDEMTIGSLNLTKDTAVDLIYDLDGGASASCGTGKFEIKFRFMCCYSGLDSTWEKCQCFCVHCSCTIM
jgi:Ubiquitin family